MSRRRGGKGSSPTRLSLRQSQTRETPKRSPFLRFAWRDSLLIVALLSLLLAPLTMFAADSDYSLDKVDPLKRHGGGNPITLAVFVIKYIMGFLGAIVFGVFIYGGITILFSRGDSNKVNKGKKTLLYATLGIMIIFFSYAILNLLFTVLDKIKR